MPSHPQELSADRFVRQMALFYASTFVAMGVHLPFLPVWLAAKGLESQTIGVLLALPIILRLFVIPVATRAADRHDALWAVIMAATLVALIGFGALGFTGTTLAIAVLYPPAATAFMLLFVLSDVYALRGLAPRRRAYGPVRLWGSAAFIVTNLAAGYLLDLMAARDLIWLIAAAMALCLAAAWVLPPLPPPHHGVGKGEGMASAAGGLHAERADPDRRRGCAHPLDRDGVRTARRVAAATAMPARAVIRRDAPRHAGVHRTCGAGRPCGDRARLSRGLYGCGDGVRDRIVGPALRAFRRHGLWRDGARRRGRRRRGAGGASNRDEERSLSYWQVRYIEASSRPLRYFISRVRPPRLAIHFFTFCG